ncbi:MAG TPA: GyrI-like domain-containing protein [Streptosporangiaceae bacterium]
MIGTAPAADALLKARKGIVQIVDVPEFCYASVLGSGPPGGPEFTDALQALYSVSYTAHFLVKKETGAAPRVMPLEGLWWADGPDGDALFTAVAQGEAEIAAGDRERWRWRLLIMQPAPVDEDVIARALAAARAKKPLPGLDRLRCLRWEEGRCAQLLHVGPYAAEGPSIAALQAGLAEAGYRPRGRHHEIYLGDPRRSAPERLRTILRHPVEPA